MSVIVTEKLCDDIQNTQIIYTSIKVNRTAWNRNLMRKGLMTVLYCTPYDLVSKPIGLPETPIYNTNRLRCLI